MSDWLTEQLRLTVFTTEDMRGQAPRLWSEIAGTEPEATTIQRGGPSRIIGSFRDGYCNLLFDVQADRVDWVMAAVLRPNEPPTGFPTFAEFDNAIGILRETFERWFCGLGSVKRAAIGAVLILPVGNREEGYRRIAKFLPAVNIDPVNTSDFSYSINRPRISQIGVPQLKINRLMTWSVAKLGGFQIQGLLGQPMSMVEVGGDWHACRLEMDLNTMQELPSPIGADYLAPLFGELVALGQEVSESGDMP